MCNIAVHALTLQISACQPPAFTSGLTLAHHIHVSDFLHAIETDIAVKHGRQPIANLPRPSAVAGTCLVGFCNE